MLRLSKSIKFDKDTVAAGNLTQLFEDEDLKKIGTWVWDGFVKDKQSRAAWEERMNASMDLAMQIQQAKNFPWPNCSNIVFPLVSIAAVQFSTRSYPSLIRGTQVVKYRVVGKDPNGNLQRRANLIGQHMSWQVLEQDCSWEEQHQRLFINLAIVGTNFIKTRYSSILGHNTSELVMARDLVVDYYAKSIESARRKTHILPIYRNEIWERVHTKDDAGNSIYRDVLEEDWYQSAAKMGVIDDINSDDHDKRIGISPPEGDEDTPFACLEQHCWMDLDGDGYAEPYIVLVESASRAVLRIVSRVDRWEDVKTDADGTIIAIKPLESFTKYGFIPAPDGSIYDMGFGVLLGPLNETVDSAVNQMFDAGTSNMLGGGFVTTSAKLKAGTYTRTPGEWKVIKGMGDDIRKAMVNFQEIPIPEVMLKLLQFVVTYADRLAGTVETTVGENPGQNTPAQTYQGLLENGLQIYKSIFKSVWRSMKEELKKLHALNARFMPEKETFGDKGQEVYREYYLSNSDFVVPAADPNIISDSQRIQRAVLVRQAAMQVPGYNMEKTERRWLQAIGEDDVDDIFPGPYSQWYQQHPLPNPKLQVEQAKIEGIKITAQAKLKEAALKLMSEKKKLDAQIDLMRAQAAQIVSQIGAEKAAQQLEAFDVLMTHLANMGEVMNERINSLNEAAQEAGGDENQSGGGRRLENAPGNQEGSEALPGAGGQPARPMGGGGVPEGE